VKVFATHEHCTFLYSVLTLWMARSLCPLNDRWTVGTMRLREGVEEGQQRRVSLVVELKEGAEG